MIFCYGGVIPADGPMNKFYYGISWGSDVGIPADRMLISAASMYSRKKFRIIDLKHSPKEIMLDWGGFSWFSKHNSYPFSTNEYWEFVKDFVSVYPQTTYVAMMDYPCGPLINDLNSMNYSNKTRIHASIQNYRELIKKPIGAAEWMATVQGYSLHEYSYCSELLCKFGLYTPLTAIGSVCQRKRTNTIKSVLLHVISKNPSVKYHAFGLQLRELSKQFVKDVLESSDSGSWKFRSGSTDGCWKPKTFEEKLDNFVHYRMKIEETILGDFRNRNLAGGI